MAHRPRRLRVSVRVESLEPRSLLSGLDVEGPEALNWVGRLGPTDSVIARFADEASRRAAEGVLAASGDRVVRTWPSGASLVALGPGVRPSETLTRLQGLPGVLYAQTNSIRRLAATPNDPLYGSQFQLNQANNADIDAPEAWDITKGKRSVVVAVTDTGIDYTHPDLYLNMWLNQEEIPAGIRSSLVDTDANALIDFRDLNSRNAAGGVVVNGSGQPINSPFVSDRNGNTYIDAQDLLTDPAWSNGLDDDGNGALDDLSGYNFASDPANKNAKDDQGHGTFVAGLTGASTNNGLGVAGVAWDVRLVAVKFLASNGSGTDAAAIESINYAADLGADVINASWGGTDDAIALLEAIQYAGTKGTVFVAAAGNAAVDNDVTPFYPASYRAPSLISVASINSSGGLSWFSNYGDETVDVGAPGEGVVSTISGGFYGSGSGTSFAAPLVSGAVALAAGLYPNLDAKQMVAHVLSKTKAWGSLAGKTVTGGLISARRVLETPAPAPIPFGLSQGGFEAPVVPQQGGGFQYRPTGSAWTFAGGSGLAGNSSGFTTGNSPAPEGTQVALLQGAGARISQTVAGWAEGIYRLTFRSARRGNWGGANDFRVSIDGTALGVFNPSTTTYAALQTSEFAVAAGDHAISFVGLNTAGGDRTSFIDDVRIVRVDGPAVPNGGFEAPVQAGGGASYRPAGAGWTFTNGAGIAGNLNGFTQGNAPAPEGTQVAFLQGTNARMSQTVPGWQAGGFRVAFRAARRGSFSGPQDFRVLVDGSVLATFTVTARTYGSFATPVLQVGAGSHTIEFQSLNTAGGDNTALIDAVTVNYVAPPVNTGVAVPQGGFETPAQGSGFAYRPAGSAWTFGGGSGLAGNGSGFTGGNPAAPEGAQVAFLQGVGASVTQNVAGWSAATYVVRFKAARRGNWGGANDFRVLVDGLVVGTFTPAGTAYQTLSTGPFSVTSGAHVLRFESINSAGGDNTSFLDAIEIVRA